MRTRCSNAAAKEAYCYANPNRSQSPYGSLGHLAHSFWKPYTITVDFTDMNLYITRGKAG